MGKGRTKSNRVLGYRGDLFTFISIGNEIIAKSEEEFCFLISYFVFDADEIASDVLEENESKSKFMNIEGYSSIVLVVDKDIEIPKFIKEHLMQHKCMEFTISSFCRKANKVIKDSSSIISNMLIDQNFVNIFEDVRCRMTKNFEAKNELTTPLAYFISNMKDFSASYLNLIDSMASQEQKDHILSAFFVYLAEKKYINGPACELVGTDIDDKILFDSPTVEINKELLAEMVESLDEYLKD